MENITKEEGKDAVFECLGEGVPKPVMSIRRDNSNEDIIDSPVIFSNHYVVLIHLSLCSNFVLFFPRTVCRK